MPLICYREQRFNTKAQVIIAHAIKIIDEYSAQGYSLTLRQLYYQFVSRDLIPNTQKSYKALGETINNARLAGLIDWHSIVDRTRNLQSVPFWASPADIIRSCADQFRLDRWDDQPNYVEVWIEKDALIGVIERVCRDNAVPYFSCRGYTSQSEMWSAAQRLMEKRDDDGKEVHIIHFGDHDPSGCDMSRDIQARLEEFSFGEINFHRAALNMKQIKRFRPPPNPAKITDSRARAYIREHGKQSWELDALEPKIINGLIAGFITQLRDAKLWDAKITEENQHRGNLALVSDKWTKAVKAVTPRRK